jgi:hypothetical protein
MQHHYWMCCQQGARSLARHTVKLVISPSSFILAKRITPLSFFPPQPFACSSGATSSKLDSKYHPPCSKGVYDCGSCRRPDKSQCTKDLYFCRDDLTCPGYDLNKYKCCHGGGVVCRHWCHHTNIMAGANRSPLGRATL